MSDESKENEKVEDFPELMEDCDYLLMTIKEDIKKHCYSDFDQEDVQESLKKVKQYITIVKKINKDSTLLIDKIDKILEQPIIKKLNMCNPARYMVDITDEMLEKLKKIKNELLWVPKHN